MRGTRLLAPLAGLFLASVFLHAAGHGDPGVSPARGPDTSRHPDRMSAWRDHGITVDGAAADWDGLTLPQRDSQIALGFANDGGRLYVCLLARDPLTRDQIAMRGLIVWLTPERESRKKAFGIRFPVPPDRNPFKRRPEPPAEDTDDQPGAGPPETPILGDQEEVELLANGKDGGRRVPLAEAQGIAVRMAVHDSALVYELQVPLARNGAYEQAVGVAPGEVVRVEIETPEYREPVVGPRLRGGPIGVAVGVGPRGVRGGYPMATDPRVLMKPLDVKTTVQLASGPPE